MCFVSCAETLETMLAHFKDILKPDVDELSANSSK